MLASWCGVRTTCSWRDTTMGLLTSIMLGALAVGVAAANTADTAPDQAHAPLCGDLNEELARVAEIRAAQNKAAMKAKKPSEELGFYEWIDLLRELGWYDATVSEGLFWERLDAWDASASARLADPSGT